MQDMIYVNNLRKEFKSYANRSGLKGAFRDLFTRNYKILKAVDDISFSIKPGEMVGYIGENGAGKSTSIKMLTGILTPSAGEVKVNGFIPHEEREKFVQTIGVVFGQRSQLWWDIAVQESFRLLKKVYRVSDEQYESHMKLVIETLDLGPLLDKPVRKLSLGQRMRCELAAALIHNPPLLFLDEPTIGLDVLVKNKIRTFLKEINKRYNTTILLTTHDLADIEALCERVIMLDQGKVIYDGSLQDLRNRWIEEKEIRFEMVDEINEQQLTNLITNDVTWIKGERPNVWIAQVKDDENVISSVITKVVSAHKVKDVNVQTMSTEEIVRNIYEEGVIRG
ncbi:ATP-binding cassette domain-containing protein [Bacillaceae bacterium S4-13-58]